MNDFQKGILTLLRSAVTGEKLTLPDGFSLKDAMKFIYRQHIVTLAYTGAVNCGISKSEPEMQQLFAEYCRQLLHSERQLATAEAIFREFDANGIDYMPFKGVIMKKLYPKPELRWMADADILIRTSQYEKIRPVMLGLGLKELPESDHELKWIHDHLFVELHKYLIPSVKNLFHSYFADGWRHAGKISNTRHELAAEYHFLFMLTHIAKHYLDGGVGCRYMLDLWIYMNAYPQLDIESIRTELRKLNLLEFYENTLNLISAWFEDGAVDDKTQLMTDFIFNGGSWGTWQAHALSVEVRNSDPESHVEVSRIKHFFSILFPSAGRIKYSYPILKKHPWALPFVWPVRWVDVLVSRRGSIKRRYKELSIVDTESVNNYKDALRFVGLSFDAPDKKH